MSPIQPVQHVTRPKPAAQWRFVWTKHEGQSGPIHRHDTKVSASFAVDMDPASEDGQREIPNNFTVTHKISADSRDVEMRFTRAAAEVLRDTLTAALAWDPDADEATR